MTADWQEQEENAGQALSRPTPACSPSAATPEADSRYSWTVDFAARRPKAREEMQPILAQASKLKEQVVDLKEKLKRLKKSKAATDTLEKLSADIGEKEKSAREMEAGQTTIDAAVFDLKAVNPNTVAKFDARSPAEIIKSIREQRAGRLASPVAALNAHTGSRRKVIPSFAAYGEAREFSQKPDAMVIPQILFHL